MLDIESVITNRPPQLIPFFSICIPQYNRTDFLIKACESFASQTFQNFELCISDDCSNDGKREGLLDYLRNSGLTYSYAPLKNNLRYDGNLRSAVALSSGQYLLLMGNDDGLSNNDVLRKIREDLLHFQPVAVAITNYRDIPSGRVVRRISTHGLIGSGPAVAVSTFRNYSFVSGIVLDGDGARREATDKCDGSEMYQMYLGTRLIAAGGQFLAIDKVCVDKDLQIENQVVDSYRLKPKADRYPIVERPLPMGRLLEVVAAGLEPFHQGAARENNLLNIASQLYRYTFPFWIVEYRRIQSWQFAVGVLFALRPTRLAQSSPLSAWATLQLWLMYIPSAVAAIAIPIRLFDALHARMYEIAKRLRSV